MRQLEMRSLKFGFAYKDNTAFSLCDDILLYGCDWSLAQKIGQLVHARKMTYRTQQADVILSPSGPLP